MRLVARGIGLFVIAVGLLVTALGILQWLEYAQQPTIVRNFLPRAFLPPS